MIRAIDKPRRVTDSMVTHEAILVVGTFNKQACATLSRMAEQGPHVEPYAKKPKKTPVLACDHLRIYGRDVIRFFDQVARADPVLAIALLRSYELGIRDPSEISFYLDRGMTRPIDKDRTIKDLRKRIPGFAPSHSLRHRSFDF